MNPDSCLVLLFLVGGLLVVQSRYVDPNIRSPLYIANNNNNNINNKSVEERQSQIFDGADLFDGLQLAGFGTYVEPERVGTDLQERNFNDMIPYFGNVIYKGVVRRVVIKPMVKGFKRLIPKSMYIYYNEVLASKRVFQLISPLSPAISSYTYNKFEQGIFWSLKRGYRFMVDNFIEFEERSKRAIS